MTENKNPLCSIVIRTLNEEKHIGRLLTGILQQDYEPLEIILVDSGSSDATVSIAQTFPVKVVHIRKEDFTFGRSLNYGVEAAEGEFIINISGHCYPVYPDWVTTLIGAFRDEQVAVSYGKQRGGETNWYSEHLWFRKFFPETAQHRQGNPYTHNANAAIRRVLWEQHPYNEDLTGLEDLEWSSWALENGYLAAYIPEAEVIHLHEETLKQVHNRYKREAIAMKQILPQSRFSIWNFLRLWTETMFSDLVQARREKVFKTEWRGIIMFRFLQYLGTYQGYRYAGLIDSSLHQTFYYPPGLLGEKKPADRRIEPIDYSSLSD